MPHEPIANLLTMAKPHGYIVQGQEFYFFGVPNEDPKDPPRDPTLIKIHLVALDGRIYFTLPHVPIPGSKMPESGNMPVSDFIKMLDEGWIMVKTY